MLALRIGKAVLLPFGNEPNESLRDYAARLLRTSGVKHDLRYTFHVARLLRQLRDQEQGAVCTADFCSPPSSTRPGSHPPP
jgi:hypothetical protein